MDGSPAYRQSSFPQGFAQSWMRMTGPAQVFAARTEGNGRRNFVDQITGMRADNMRSEDAVGPGVRQDFNHAFDLTQGPGAAIGAKWKAAFAILDAGFF